MKMERMTAEELAGLKAVAADLMGKQPLAARMRTHAVIDPSTILRLVEQAGRVDRAERALLRAGFDDLGGQEWKPPLGKPPRFIEVPAAPAPPEVAVERKPVERLIEAGALRQFRHNDGSEGFVFAYDKAITDREFARCEECIGTGKCGPDDDPNEMDCEACNGSGQVGSAIDAPDNSSQIVSDLKFALTDLLHNSSAPYSGEANLDRDFQIRYDKVTERCLDLLASLDAPVAAGLPASGEFDHEKISDLLFDLILSVKSGSNHKPKSQAILDYVAKLAAAPVLPVEVPSQPLKPITSTSRR